MAKDLEEQLTKYLADVHSIEEQALTQMRSAPDIAGEEELAGVFRDHLVETLSGFTRTLSFVAEPVRKPRESI